MSVENGHANIETFNRTAIASDSKYVQTDLGIKKTDEETKNIVSSTFGELKRYADAMWYAIGLDPNVNRAYEGIMNDPNAQIAAGDKVYRPHPGVGNMRPYNEAGNPAGGAFSMHTFA